jgi:hypothetical protein
MGGREKTDQGFTAEAGNVLCIELVIGSDMGFHAQYLSFCGYPFRHPFRVAGSRIIDNQKVVVCFTHYNSGFGFSIPKIRYRTAEKGQFVLFQKQKMQ